MALFSPGDFVIYADEWAQADRKLKKQWNGPAQVENTISKWIFELCHLLAGATKEVHASRLRIYAEKELQVTGDLLDMVANNSEGHVAHHFASNRFDKPANRYEVLVDWRGITAVEATWEPAE
uniref:AlNc14C70G4828 protein n=1 Tax=Albugo laibachii Nc14 TaxID=890382 RepID=F0WDV9_9STRA|nr:AlNc14C70G4828 [Albugo laibachii Nc14]|eukprot:CCA19387.1 AlNc14C70G4828 [Albugo laibachii Nc14]